MKTQFNGSTGLIIVRGNVEGPTGHAILRLALDTGSTRTMINEPLLQHIGLTTDLAGPIFRLTTASGTGTAREVHRARFLALGEERIDFPVISHALPKASTVDGVVGLDFLRGHILKIDFPQGQISLD